MKRLSLGRLHGPSHRGWLVVLPTFLLLLLALALTETGSAAPAAQPRAEQSGLLFRQQEPLCQSCHQEQYDDWKGTTHARATVDPAFQEEVHKSGNPETCLACHTTGFDSGSGQFLAEGVTCEACHGPYKAGHPKAETMELPMESATCRLCHQAAFEQWEQSQHAANNIECFDCHKAHTQGLRLETEQKLCGACHADEQTAMAHARHGISGVACANCHMAPQMKETGSPSGMTVSMSSHTFTVAADVCARCHSDTIHATGRAESIRASAQPEAALAEPEGQDPRVGELEAQLNEAEKQLDNLRNVAVVGLGLALGVGGMVGLLLGIGGTTWWQRRRKS